ncbi:MAG: hypothetical protein MJZ50_09225 [Treponema sp.]|nr:hypothetical protein [Treponema sp.]
MKLVGLLKGKVEKAETMEEKKELIKEAGVELTDDELEGVAGGGRFGSGRKTYDRDHYYRINKACKNK